MFKSALNVLSKQVNLYTFLKDKTHYSGNTSFLYVRMDKFYVIHRLKDAT